MAFLTGDGATISQTVLTEKQSFTDLLDGLYAGGLTRAEANEVVKYLIASQGAEDVQELYLYWTQEYYNNVE